MTHEEKQARQHEEKRRRLINQGVPEDQVEARIAKEKYDNMSADKKIKLLEGMIINSFTQVAHDLSAIRHNEDLVIDSLDINSRVTSKLFQQLGIAPEIIQKMTEEAFEEVQEEKRKMQEQIAKAQERAEDEDLMKKVDLSGEDIPVPIPDGATVFGS